MNAKRYMFGPLCLVLCASILVSFCAVPATAASGTINESEGNGTYLTADSTYNDYDNYGTLSSTSDVDWWKVAFSYSGTAKFYLGNIPSDCNYNLYLYSTTGTALLKSSTKTGTSAELITYNVNAGTTYYIKISSASGSSTTSKYLFRTKVYPSKTISSVPLYVQETTTTCGCASGRMMLKSYGITVSEANFKNTANSLAGAGNDYTYVYVVTNTLNHYLANNSNSTRYKYTSVSSYTVDQYSDLVLKNILKNHPVQPLLKITNTTYFPYTSNGHYVVAKGLSYSTSLGSYNTVVNDPHYNHAATLNVPISNMLTYSKAHSGGGYLIHVDS